MPACRADLDTRLEWVRSAPRSTGTVVLVVARPGTGRRRILEAGELSLSEGLVGDDWARRPSSRTLDGSPHLDMQLNVVSSRVMACLAGTDEERAQAGDQLHLDLDLSEEHLPEGTRLRVGSAEIVVTAEPHRGCQKFADRFGADARRWVNEPTNRSLRLRGLNARVVVAGSVHPGDAVRVIERPG